MPRMPRTAREEKARALRDIRRYEAFLAVAG